MQGMLSPIFRMKLRSHMLWSVGVVLQLATAERWHKSEHAIGAGPSIGAGACDGVGALVGVGVGGHAGAAASGSKLPVHSSQFSAER